jgi:hypothetical protein
MILLMAVLAFGCNGTDAQTDAGACSCQAVSTSFDNASSSLGADNVQDAIDELAARPVAEPPIGERIETVTRVFSNPGTIGAVTQTAQCPTPARDLALGGACGFVFSAALVETRIANGTNDASYACGWDQSTAGSGNMSVTVVCLRNAR